MQLIQATRPPLFPKIHVVTAEGLISSNANTVFSPGPSCHGYPLKLKMCINPQQLNTWVTEPDVSGLNLFFFLSLNALSCFVWIKAAQYEKYPQYSSITILNMAITIGLTLSDERPCDIVIFFFDFLQYGYNSSKYCESKFGVCSLLWMCKAALASSLWGSRS